MKTSNFIFSIVEVLLVIITLGIGIFFISCPYAPNFCVYVAHIFLYKSDRIFTMGIIFVLISAAMLSSFYSFNQHKTFKVKIKNSFCSVNSAIVEEYVKKYMLDNYPHAKFSLEVLVDYKRRIDIVIHQLFHMEEEMVFLEKLKNYLQKLFLENFNYKSDFFITIKK